MHSRITVHKVVVPILLSICSRKNFVFCKAHDSHVNLNFWVYAERLLHKPLLTRGPENATMVIGETTNMSCIFLSDLSIHLRWFKAHDYCNDSVVFAQGKVHTLIGMLLPN